jgi:hypothetical protein
MSYHHKENKLDRLVDGQSLCPSTTFLSGNDEEGILLDDNMSSYSIDATWWLRNERIIIITMMLEPSWGGFEIP